MEKTGITIYGCEEDEADLFRRYSPHYGVEPTIIESAVSADNAALASGNCCISVNHKTEIGLSTLRALKENGVAYISTRSIGCNHIDMEAAEKLGITIDNVAYSPASVADYTLMLILMSLRNAKSVLCRADAHDYKLCAVPGRELRDMTVGILGTGRIGQAVIDRLNGFGCRILAYNLYPQAKAEYVTLDELLRQSDILTLHMPLNADTYHILDRKRIKSVKHGAFVINTARGSLIDTEALIWALENGRLGGAALDVVEGEEGIFYHDRTNKPVNNQFLPGLQKLPNAIVTPHTAFYTDHALQDIVENTIQNCLEFERGTR
ncbi:D-lactate dehydrogenase VanH-E [Paenibacillus macerans]|uniref:D-lactate dehydrogenase VanH-E n=1 Tax=Paenibacillus macerans TaxID=44252 RepID=A0A6N8EWZ5_PAEMA|nr:D-isomer specific 2-hydroxyacid dehydrogenase family protein [Paenibacillus macerans]MUG23310.1 D-lactate dehydrogenase VanH-E [Paenibacillus macerans]UMV50913.1 D-isomer specific 2-hydroxyacid dehydrogenase family protein [Paenibacillus macerans]